MEKDIIINEMVNNKLIIQYLLSNVDSKLKLWKQNPQKWCLLEIICHLYDEEREDFRIRLMTTLDNPDQEFEPIDPVGWITSRKYMEQNFDEKLNCFLTERDISLQYLQQLNNPKWDNFYKHPKLGDLSAEMFFTNWLAHDYLHIRQIIKLKYDFLNNMTTESLDYAGNW